MKMFKYSLLVVVVTLFGCEPDTSEMPTRKLDTGVTEISLNLKGSGTVARTNSIGFIYKNSIWLKKGAIQISKPAGKAVVFNPELWTILEHNNLLGAYTAGTFSDSGCNCASDEVCINGSCTPVNPCGGGCPHGTTCINGICVSDNPCNGGCPADQTCVNGICTPNDPCSNCTDDEVCINGMCMPGEPCGGECPPGEVCINGICTPDPCDDCEEDEICINGQCQDMGGAGGIGEVQTANF